MKKVIVYTENRRYGSGANLAFSSEEKCLDYFRKLHPEAKSLRLSRSEYAWERAIVLLNHNTHVLSWDADIREVELDPR
jgi:hypothetical protein